MPPLCHPEIDHRKVSEKNASSSSLVPDLGSDVGLFERLTWARKVLGLAENVTRKEIDLRTKDLLKQWHPDRSNREPAASNAMTRRILEARAIIDTYIENYRFAFTREESDNYLSPQEWWQKRFGGDPTWTPRDPSKNSTKTG